MAKLIYIFALVIVCSVITANARECYVCTGCHTVDSSHRQTCPPIPTLPNVAAIPEPSTFTSDSVSTSTRENSNIGCIELGYEVAGETIFARSCYYPPSPPVETNEVCRLLAGSGSVISKCNICFEDLCNSSEKATATIALIAASLITTFFYIKQ